MKIGASVSRFRALWPLLGAAGCLSTGLAHGCAAKKPPEPHAPAANVVRVESNSLGREHVAITVYNQNFGLVREWRSLRLGEGRRELLFRDVAAEVQPETVHIRAVDDPRQLSVLEQNYRYDLLTPETLLSKFLGKRVKVYRYNEKLGTDEVKEAEVLASDQGLVLRIDGEVSFGVPGRLAFPELPLNLVAKPTLFWLLDSAADEQTIEVSYLTGGLNWRADYVLVVDASDTKGDLTGWVTLSNQSGMSFEDAELKLVAGNVQRVQPDVDERARVNKSLAAAAPSGLREQGLFEYHLYSLERPTTLRDKEQKQTNLLAAYGLSLEKKLVYRGNAYYFRNRYSVVQNQKVEVYLSFQNSEKNGLGVPLPKGIVRAYKADDAGGQQFIGEDTIEHTPRDEALKVKLGESFDLVVERKQLSFAALGRCGTETDWEIEIRNHKDRPETVEVDEPVGGDFEVVQSSHVSRRGDAQTLVFDLAVPARHAATLTYRLRTRWC